MSPLISSSCVCTCVCVCVLKLLLPLAHKSQFLGHPFSIQSTYWGSRIVNAIFYQVFWGDNGYWIHRGRMGRKQKAHGVNWSPQVHQAELCCPHRETQQLSVLLFGPTWRNWWTRYVLHADRWAAPWQHKLNVHSVLNNSSKFKMWCNFSRCNICRRSWWKRGTL